ncbi:MAG: hypothetical protein LBK82_08245, partial [Planctomycetaceae bacterium]|nr:hypothetical protein [Planctomycetaceae bacterium]
QIQCVFQNGTAKKGTPIIYTEIGIIHGKISNSVFELLGLLDFVRKCASVLHIKRNMRTFFHGALACYGIKHVKEYYFLSGSNVKLYGFFTI